jgi:hypothetical protein
MKAGSLIGLIFLLVSCAKEIKRNLEDWEGEWNIATEIEGNTTAMHDFLSMPWKDGEITSENFGTLVVDGDGKATLTFLNNEFSDTAVTPYTAKGYLHVYGKSHLEFYGLKVTESSDPDLSVGEEIGDDGHAVFWMRDNDGKERIAELDDASYGLYGFFKSPTARWLVFTRK